jgi:L-lactate permease
MAFFWLVLALYISFHPFTLKQVSYSQYIVKVLLYNPIWNLLFRSFLFGVLIDMNRIKLIILLFVFLLSHYCPFSSISAFFCINWVLKNHSIDHLCWLLSVTLCFNSLFGIYKKGHLDKQWGFSATLLRL